MARLTLDDELVEQARELGGHATNRAAVTAALEEYVRQRRLHALLEMMGTVDFDPGWDPKVERLRKADRMARYH